MQHLIRTALPTSFGFRPLKSAETESRSSNAEKSEDRFGDIFARVATIDMSPYLCVVEALRFRNQICGGEELIREYCFTLAQEGALSMETILGTVTMNNATRTLGQCCLCTVRLPLEFDDAGAGGKHHRGSKKGLTCQDGPTIAAWIVKRLMMDFNTWIPAGYYEKAVWVRVSAQLYLDLEDFKWAARCLLDLCHRVEEGDWRS
jgi:hypothetical protein